MRHIIITLFYLLYATNIHCQGEDYERSILDLRFRYGLIVSYMGGTGESPFDICDNPRRCTYTSSYRMPMPAKYINFMASFNINAKNSLSLGYIYTQHGNREVLLYNDVPVLHFDYLLEYYGFNIRHQKNFLHSERLKMGIANGLEIEYLTQLEFGAKDLYKKGKSWLSEINITYSITKRIAIDLNCVYKLAIVDYGEKTWNNEDFRRTGAGMLIGISYSIFRR
jgi:hypothetical protein